MKRSCQQCGEELIGAVNRCWNCGVPVVIEPSYSEPPVRRGPVNLNAQGNDGEQVRRPSEAGPQLWVLQRLASLGPQRCATASIAVGVLGCIIGIATGWAALFGFVGIALGVVGMPSHKRDLATMGLVLAVIALFLGFGQIGFDLWVRYASQQWINDLQGIR